MAFFTSTVRQAGFAPPPTSSSSNNGANDFADIFAPPDNASGRRFPPSALDFGDELAALMDERAGSAGGGGGPGGGPTYPPHNIFDVSAPPHAAHALGLHNEYPHAHTNFNSTLPALNSSMRYEPHGGSPGTGAGAARGSPSPGAVPGSPHSPVLSPSTALASALSAAHLGAGAGASRASRSRSRPPLTASLSAFCPVVCWWYALFTDAYIHLSPSIGAGSTHGGPARTTRARRTGSVSGTSPPPVGAYARSGAVGIPRGGGGSHNGGASNGGDWFSSS